MSEWFKKVAEKVATFFMRGDLGASWDSQCRLGGILERLVGDSEPSWERLGSALERLRGVLGASWRHLGHLRGVLGASWRHLGHLGGVLEAPWRRLGGEDREMARKSQLKAPKYPFYLDSVTCTLKKHRKTRGGPDKI